ncbi:SDR family NAD(P)-dependent oxidoreductase [Niveispirillum fermenti]|uniref:SDR family NAD(P)-dependent oxidoreductase n=1 Tax=Niveispirillum fermenti TaxID=1233113 RepID=UPI003A873DF1
MKALKFYARFLPSFTAIGFVARGLSRRPVRADFSGQTWMVTGATGGIGRAVALAAAAAGAHVIAVGRRPALLEALAASATGTITPVAADLSLVARNRELAERHPEIDVLVNNVGILDTGYHRTEEGFSRMYATNLLGHFALTEGLLARGRLRRGTVINVTSGGAYNAPLNLPGLDAREADFNGFAAYASQKRAQIALADHWNAAVPGLRAYTMHPGWVRTDGVRSALPWMDRWIGAVLRTTAQGADTILWLAATQPPPQADVIWFDRAPRPAHMFATTREAKTTIPALAARLQHDMEGVTG